MKKNKLGKFNFKYKKVFVVGGSGLLGIEIIKILLENHATVINLDITVICEEPKIVKYANKILKNLSKLLSIKQEKISLKATTTEGLGFTGRKEGIAVTSNILVNIKS